MTKSKAYLGLRNSILTVVLVTTSIWANAQIDSLMQARLTKPVVIDCENIAFNCQEVISKYPIEEADSIQMVLDFWKKSCGTSEPTRRVELLLAISDGSFTDSAFFDYGDQYGRAYYWRFYDSQRDSYETIYQNRKASYDFVPLRSAFDAWTAKVAEQLLVKVPEKSAQYLYCLLLCNRFAEYERCVVSQEYSETLLNKDLEKRLTELWQNDFSFSVSAGMWLPLMKLSHTFSNSPELGFRMGLPIGKGFRLETLIAVRFLLNDKDFEFYAYDSINVTNATAGVLFGLNLKKEYYVSNELAFNINSGIGVNMIDTDIERPQEEWGYDQNGKATNRYYGVETFDLTIGLGFRKRIFNTNSIGMELNYHYSPYQIDEDLVNNFGDQYVSLVFVYGF